MATVVLCDRCRKQIDPSEVYKLVFRRPLSTELVCNVDICSDYVRSVLRYIDPYKEITINVPKEYQLRSS